MAILWAAVAVVGVLCLLDLLFTVGVIRRLREHTELLAQLKAALPAMPPLAAPGTRVADVGVPAAIVGFFSPGCGPCAKLLPEFVSHVAGESVLAVVVGDGPEAEGMVAALEPVARVIREDHGGTVAAAFGVSSFPSLFALDGERTITASGHDLLALREPVAAGHR
ncbi:hypothetical protein ABT369_06475 [Dactylosporangium sp. NPDC000244]|uniref:TlpA family protein disulfide reductase n=1 Tax=Dactylosporangium sp. NPDC000244 TaxID=3154365 RepID=UPI00332DC312